jgi:hypothetical protein
MKGWRWRVGDLDSSLGNIVLLVFIVGIYLQINNRIVSLSVDKRTPREPSRECNQKKYVANAHIPSRNAQTWLQQCSVKVAQRRGL